MHNTNTFQWQFVFYVVRDLFNVLHGKKAAKIELALFATKAKASSLWLKLSS